MKQDEDFVQLLCNNFLLHEKNNSEKRIEKSSNEKNIVSEKISERVLRFEQNGVT